MHTLKSVLVTGGAGFIGSNYLLRMVPRHPGVRFVNLDLLTYAGNPDNLSGIQSAENYRFVEGDVADGERVRSLFEEEKFTSVVHFAAESHVDRSIVEPLAFVQTNVMGTATLLDAARKAWKNAEDVRFHHVSTDEVFGELGDTGFFTETTAYDPNSPYSASKAASDHLVRAYHHTYKLPVVLSNCSNNYGPYQFPEKLIPLMILKALRNEPLPVYGKGENVRDWIHVEDHCEALEVILTRGRAGETYVVGGRSEQMNLDLVKMLADRVDEQLEREIGTTRKLITFVTDRPGHDFRYAIDCSKIENELDWKPNHTMETGLRETVKWYVEHQEWLKKLETKSK